MCAKMLAANKRTPSETKNFSGLFLGLNESENFKETFTLRMARSKRLKIFIFENIHKNMWSPRC